MKPTISVPAHPRSRGENSFASTRPLARFGSSPLTRGKPAHAAGARNRAGLIPAHAGKTRAREGRHAHYRAHPRSRGENVFAPRKHPSNLGSSPLTRGKHRHREAPGGEARLIPAHAGKTTVGAGAGRPSTAHPRSRGENHRSVLSGRFRRGSSPLTRGKLKLITYSRPASRLIPAHAGKTPRTRPSQACHPAHPRSRGENPRCVHFRTVGSGSSPLTRGKRRGVDRGAEAPRLIPAHAGKTRPRTSSY